MSDYRMPYFEADCPKCGHPLELIPWSSKTDYGVMQVDAMCANCMHVERVTFLVTRKGE